MLHRSASPYRGERNSDLLKFKPHGGAEARVLEHIATKVNHSGGVGAVVVEMPDGQRFKPGAGFSDAEREHPPGLGCQITYRYNGTNASGLPSLRASCGSGPTRPP